MSEYIFKLPDLGEGTVEAEIVEWFVHPGDVVREGQIIVDVMTDKASIEVPSPAAGRVLRTSGQPGDMVIVGTELIAIETDGKTPSAGTPASGSPIGGQPPTSVRTADSQIVQPLHGSAVEEPTGPGVREPVTEPVRDARPYPSGARVLVSPALRRHASELGIDLVLVRGSGPRGRILRKDLEAHAARNEASGAHQASSQQPSVPLPSLQPPSVQPLGVQQSDVSPTGEYTEVRIIGVRRVIAERMQAAKREIPHFAYVEEIDVTALERLRTSLNERPDHDRLTLLPFIGLALPQALRKFPQCNALHDAQTGVLRRYHSVHLGIATQTPDGLKVPVIRCAERFGLDALAAEINLAASKARDGSATRADLSGSTFTLTSLGKLGGIVSTPVINSPEMAIIGVNKAVLRPMVIAGRIEIRLMMNLSASFDHRFIDGFDAASMIQAVKALLEEPALLFVSA